MEKKLFKEIFDESRREILINHPAYEDFRKDLQAAYEYARKNELKPITFSVLRIYNETGSRTEYESEYFSRRRALTVSFIYYMLYGGDDNLRFLEDIIMLVCDEYTWALPAHWRGADDCKTIAETIDLFAAETGQALAEIYYVLGGKLNKYVSSRIKYELDRRIINAFINKHEWFEDTQNNWLTVCGGCVGMTFIYIAPEKFALIKERIKACMVKFIASYTDDGICTEGPMYWNYGFGYFIYFNELYREFAGEYILKPDEKMKKIASFRGNMMISGKKVVNFSDCQENSIIRAGLVTRLRERFGDEVGCFDEYSMPVREDANGRFAPTVRDWFWSRCEENTGKNVQRTGMTFSDEAKWYMRRTEKYFFAAKGGNNDELHNHNDLGSFILSDYENQLVAELGAAEYTKEYFETETRYEYLSCSSRGHSVPLINGKPQCLGKEYCAEILRVEENCFELDLSAAYDADVKAIRRFDMDCDGVTLTDNVQGAKEWTQRIVAKVKPEITQNGVRIGKMLLESDFVPQISEDIMMKHNCVRVPETVYLIDYKRCGENGVIRMSL